MGKTTDIRAAVEAELTFDPRVDDADVHVANMNGDVALNGTVPSYPQYLEAAAAGGSGSPEHGRRGRIPGPAEALRSDPWVWWCNSGPDVDPGQAVAVCPGASCTG
jgi:BON domain